MLILQAAREVVEEEGFDDLLDSVRARIDEIESLHRTRELTVCLHCVASSFNLTSTLLVQGRRWRRLHPLDRGQKRGTLSRRLEVQRRNA
jgi:hypothetical protein